MKFDFIVYGPCAYYYLLFSFSIWPRKCIQFLVKFLTDRVTAHMACSCVKHWTEICIKTTLYSHHVRRSNVSMMSFWYKFLCSKSWNNSRVWRCYGNIHRWIIYMLSKHKRTIINQQWAAEFSKIIFQGDRATYFWHFR